MRRPAMPLARWGDTGELLALVATAPVAEPEAPEVEVVEVDEQPPPAERTPLDDTDLPDPEGGVRWRMPIFVLEGWETSDGRYIEPGALGRRDLPQSLMAMLRNPDGGWGHDAAIIAGRIDEMERYDASAVINRETGEPYGPGVWAWRAAGWFIPTPEQPGSEATLRYVRERALRGVSVDLGEVVAEEDVLEVDDEGWPERVRMRVTQGSIAQATVCPFAAFPGAYIELDDESESAAEDAEPAPALAASALRIITPGDRRSLTASAGVAPALPPREWFSRVEQPDPARHVYLGRNPDGSPTGQVWGYIAEWGVAHAGIRDRAVYAPRLGPNGYGAFMCKATPTADGGEVQSGTLSFGGGHADLNYGVIAALAHYDNVATAYADVVVGEDDFGLWFAGAMRPNLTREQIETFGRHPLSGDWRADPGDVRERLVAACSVNTPGFTIGARRHLAASGARALVAAGSEPLARRARRAEQGGLDEQRLARVLDERMRPLYRQAARDGLARLRGR